MKTLTQLTTHINKYQDTVVILGKDFINQKEIEYDKFFNKKTLRKFPEEFIKYYNKILNDYKNYDYKNYDFIKLLKHNNFIKDIINLNIDDYLNDYNIINLHGSIYEYVCQNFRCDNKKYQRMHSLNNMLRCNKCNKDMRPNILLLNEKYNDTLYNKTIDIIENTHTLLLFGYDYKENAINNLLSDYCNLKAITQDEKTENNQKEERALLSIIDKDLKYDNNDLNEIGFHDFIVKDNIYDALKRLYNGLKIY